MLKEIPTVELTQELLDKNPNCSVCWEEFKLEENVLKLECNHCFHKVTHIFIEHRGVMVHVPAVRLPFLWWSNNF